MWEASYGKEPFDLRLTVLRMVRSLHKIIGITLIGTLVFGGGYYVKNVLLNRNISYAATSTYQVSYVEEPSKSGDYYINEMTWNTYVHSEEFLTAVWGHLQEAGGTYASVPIRSAEELAGMVEAKLASDIHVPSTIVSTPLPEFTAALAEAVERSMVEEFAEGSEQVSAIRVIDPGVTVEKTVPDVRPFRAFVLSAVLSCFFALIVFLLKEAGDDCIWLPATLRRRYGLKALGTLHSPELVSNLEYLFGDKKRIAVCTVDEGTDPMETAQKLQDLARVSEGKKADAMQKWIPFPAPLACPEACEAMRGTDGVLLLVRAGAHVEKTLEYILEYLWMQEIPVSGALLLEADEWLLRMYYRLPGASQR